MSASTGMEERPRVLVVDDDPGVRDWLAVLGGRFGYEVEAVGTGEAAIRAFERRRADLVTLDVLLPGMDGLATLARLRELDPRLPVVMLSGHGPTRTIVEAVRLGASDFLRKPCDPDELERAFEKVLSKQERTGRIPRRARANSSALADLLAPEEGRSFLRSPNPKMRVVRDVLEHVSDTDITVLVRGESGVGKELFAQLIHQRSARSERAFVKVNCAALPAELLESELFGYEKGAFTGAQRRKLGKFEIADSGTIFLDEISEMHPSLQAKLLQVLQDGQFARLGGEQDVRVDARVIAATNRDLEASVREGAFREDLFYRLNVVGVLIPPLRDRKEEVPSLTELFIAKYAREYQKPALAPSDELMEAFLTYRWPGNIRELENLVKRMVVLGSEQPVHEELATRVARDFEQCAAEDGRSELERFLTGKVSRVSLKDIARQAAQAAERRLIERVLERTRWNRKEAAEILQISYKALLYKMRDAGLADRV